MRYKRGQNPSSIKNLKKRWIVLRKMYKINHNYFSKLTVENCYYAGFIAGDGSIRKNNLIIQVQEEDKYILDNFLSSVKSTNKVRKIKKGKLATCDHYRIDISSSKIIQALKSKFSITERKSLTLISPNLKKNEHKDAYIKGILDADGCIHLSKKHGLSISFCGTRVICEYLILRFSEILGYKIKQKAYKIKNKKLYAFKFSDTIARKIFLHFYKIKFGLVRKWSDDKYEFCKNWKSKRININKCEIMYNLQNKYSYKEIANMKRCSYSNIQIFFKSKMYQDFLNKKIATFN